MELGFYSLQEKDIILFSKAFKTDSEVQPIAYSMCIRDVSLGIKRPGPEAGQPLSYSDEIKNTWNISSLSNTSS
jgi:hypothetical protein